MKNVKRENVRETPILNSWEFSHVANVNIAWQRLFENSLFCCFISQSSDRLPPNEFYLFVGKYLTKFPVESANCKVLKRINKAWRMEVCFVVVYTVLRRPSFVIARMNTVTIFFNRQGSHLLISGKYSRIKPFRVQTNRINIYMVTVIAPYFKFLHQRYLGEHSQK